MAGSTYSGFSENRARHPPGLGGEPRALSSSALNLFSYDSYDCGLRPSFAACAVKHCPHTSEWTKSSAEGLSLMWRETMDHTGATSIRKHRVKFWAIVVAGSAIAITLACLTAASMHTTAIKAETANALSAQVEPATPAKGETTPAVLEFKPSPVIEPDPGFFVGAGDGGNGYYAERPAR
jgi:hypothetical protein